MIELQELIDTGHKKLTAIFSSQYSLLLMFILMGLLWFYNINDYLLWIDEFFSINIAQRPLSMIWSMDSHANKFYFNTLPPLYETVLHFFWDISGQNLILPRFLSLVFTGIAIFFIYKLCVLLFDKIVALYAVFFAVVNHSYIIYAKMIRHYSLLNALTIISFYIFFRFVKFKDHRVWTYLGLFVVNTAILYTFYFGIFVILIEFLLLIFLFRNRAHRALTWWIVLTPFALIPWAKHLKEDLYREVAVSSSNQLPGGEVWSSLLERMVTPFSNLPFFLLFLVLLIAAIRYSVILLKKNDPQGRYLISLVIILLLPLSTVTFLTYKVCDPMRSRYFFSYLFPWFILVAVFLQNLRSRKRHILTACVLIFSLITVYLVHFNPNSSKTITGYPADVAVLAKTAREFKTLPEQKISIEIDTDLFLPLFVYYYHGPQYFRGMSYPDLGAELKRMNQENPRKRIFRDIPSLNNGMFFKNDIEGLGIDWEKFCNYMIVNGWADPINKTEILMKARVDLVKNYISRDFHVDANAFAKKLAIVSWARPLSSIKTLNDVDWLYLVYDKGNQYLWDWELFPDYYTKAMLASNFQGHLELTLHQQLGGYILDIYKVLKE